MGNDDHRSIVILAMNFRAASRPALATALGVRCAAAPTLAGFHVSAAPQASLRELEARVKSVKNIEKITKSMKMIAATRLGRAQRAMDSAVAELAKAGGEQPSIIVLGEK